MAPGTPTLEEALAAHGGMMVRIAAAYERDPAAREDLVQDMALALWRALPNWRQEASLKAYVARVAQNVALSHVAKAARRPRMVEVPEDLAAHGPDPEGAAEEASRRRALGEAVRSLPVNLRQVAALALEGFAPAEIADILGITANNAAVRLNRAKRQLGAQLAPQKREVSHG